MVDVKEITSLTIENELHTCPGCGYTLGFHTSFVSTNTGRDDPVRSTREAWRVILICPECGARYDVGWRISFADMSRFMKAPFKTAPCVPHGSPAACLLPPRDENPPE
jgi:hypothetical protein